MIATPPAVRPLVKRSVPDRRRAPRTRPAGPLPAVWISLGLGGLLICTGVLLGWQGLWALLGVGLLLALALRLDIERRARLRAEREARTDALTGLLGRRGLDEALAARPQASPLSLLLLDLDHFKRINDACGHLAGDRVLSDVASVLRRAVRMGDVVGRWGGEEFVVLLPGLDSATARAVAERLRAALSDRVTVRGEAVTVSIGVATSAGQEAPQELLSRADAALYAAKRGGRNRTVVGGELEEQVRERCWN